MQPLFICHPLFADAEIINVFHKEKTKFSLSPHPKELKNKHILFRKSFTLDAFESAVLRVTADDHYKLYVNGEFVCEGPAPAYPWSYFYNEIDVTQYLKKGKNVIALHTYYQGLINRTWISGDLRQMLWMQLSVDGSDVLVSDTSFRCALHSGFTPCGVFGYDTAYGERYDSRSPEKDFMLPEFDDSGWGYAAVSKNADHKLVKQPTVPLVYEKIAPVIRKTQNNTVFLDFGREAVGYLCAKAKGGSGDTVVMRFGEELEANGAVRYKLRCNCNYQEEWVLSGEEDTLNEYDFKAFRYCEIDLPTGATLTDVYLNARLYPYEEKAVYETENEDLKKVLRLCLDTVKYGMQEGFYDCPTREKGSYLGDISIAGRAHAVATGDTTMMKKAVTLFCDTAPICKGLLAVSNSSLMQEIADYSLQFAAQLLWIYKTDGDIEFLKKTEPYATGVLEYFLGYADKSGLISGITEKWNLVDWPENLRDGYDFPLTNPIGPGVHNVINAFWYGSITALDEIYAILGKPRLTDLKNKVCASFFDKFYCEDRLLFCDAPKNEAKPHFAVHSSILPLLFGMADGNEPLKKSIAKFIESKSLASMGVYMAYFALAALKLCGEHELCVKLATDEKCWINMLNEGATTTFEAWGADQKWNTSLFHPWAACPVIIFEKNALPY